MEVLREHKDSVMAVLEAFVYDPLLNWRLMDSEFQLCGMNSLYVLSQPGLFDISVYVCIFVYACVSQTHYKAALGLRGISVFLWAVERSQSSPNPGLAV